jgi:hypothetical protein
MEPRRYEVAWWVETGSATLVCTEFKVFSSETEAQSYGVRHEEELKGGTANDFINECGCSFKYFSARESTEFDGLAVTLKPAMGRRE